MREMETVQVKREVKRGRELLEERLLAKVDHSMRSGDLGHICGITAELIMQVYDLKVEVRKVADALEKIDGEGVKTFVS